MKICSRTIAKELTALDVFMQWLRRQSIQCFSFSNSSHGASEFVDILRRRALVSSSGRGDVRVRILVCFIQGFGEVQFFGIPECTCVLLI